LENVFLKNKKEKNEKGKNNIKKISFFDEEETMDDVLFNNDICVLTTIMGKVLLPENKNKKELYNKEIKEILKQNKNNVNINKMIINLINMNCEIEGISLSDDFTSTQFEETKFQKIKTKKPKR